jgi:hypothetical protein
MVEIVFNISIMNKILHKWIKFWICIMDEKIGMKDEKMKWMYNFNQS